MIETRRNTYCAICGAETGYQQTNGNGHPVCKSHQALVSAAGLIRKKLSETRPDEIHALRAIRLYEEMDAEAQYGISLLIAAMIANFHARRIARGYENNRYLGPTAGLELLVALIEADEL
jgi:hypothetical protein